MLRNSDFSLAKGEVEKVTLSWKHKRKITILPKESLINV